MAVDGPSFHIYTNGARLTGVLFSALLSSRWATAQVTVSDSVNGQVASGETLIENRNNSRTLSVFSQPPAPEEVAPRLRAEGSSMLMFGASRDELESALRALEGGAAFVSPEIVRQLALANTGADEVPRLTEREMEVLRLVASGLSNRETAERLVISTNTVRTHLRSISAQFGVRSRGKLAARARELGLG